MGVCNTSKRYRLLFNKQLGGNISVVHISSIPKLFDDILQFQVTWKYCVSLLPSPRCLSLTNQIALVRGNLIYVFFSSLVLLQIPAHTTLSAQMFEL